MSPSPIESTSPPSKKARFCVAASFIGLLLIGSEWSREPHGHWGHSGRFEPQVHATPAGTTPSGTTATIVLGQPWHSRITRDCSGKPNFGWSVEPVEPLSRLEPGVQTVTMRVENLDDELRTRGGVASWRATGLRLVGPTERLWTLHPGEREWRETLRVEILDPARARIDVTISEETDGRLGSRISRSQTCSTRVMTTAITDEQERGPLAPPTGTRLLIMPTSNEPHSDGSENGSEVSADNNARLIFRAHTTIRER